MHTCSKQHPHHKSKVFQANFFYLYSHASKPKVERNKTKWRFKKPKCHAHRMCGKIKMPIFGCAYNKEHFCKFLRILVEIAKSFSIFYVIVCLCFNHKQFFCNKIWLMWNVVMQANNFIFLHEKNWGFFFQPCILPHLLFASFLRHCVAIFKLLWRIQPTTAFEN